jgi:hypothetical protein
MKTVTHNQPSTLRLAVAVVATVAAYYAMSTAFASFSHWFQTEASYYAT